MGGEVDQQFYIPTLDLVDHKNFTEAVVNRRSSLDLEFKIETANSTLRLVCLLVLFCVLFIPPIATFCADCGGRLCNTCA